MWMTEKMTHDQVRGMVTKSMGKGRWLTIESLANLRRQITRSARKTGWTTKAFDGYMAILQESGVVKMSKKDAHTGTPHRRAIAIAMATGTTAQVAKIRTTDKVRKWMKQRAQTQEISAAMVRAMERNLKTPKQTTATVAAAICIVAQEDKYIVETRRKARGGKDRDWADEAMEWAISAGWMTRAGTRKTLQYMHKNTQEETRKRQVAIDLGVGWRGASEGLETKFDKVVGMDCEQQKMNKTTYAVVDIKGKFQDKATHKGGLISWVQMMGGIRKGELVAVWASPSCIEETKAQRMNKNKEHGKGVWAGKKRSKAGQAALDAIRTGIQQAVARDPNLQYCIENPAETAIKTDKKWMKAFGEGRVIPACPYGKKHDKKYHMWMSARTSEEFDKVEIQPRDEASWCEDCKAGRRKHSQAQCPQRGDTRGTVSEEGMNKKAAKNRIPKRLAAIIGECMIKAYHRG